MGVLSGLVTREQGAGKIKDSRYRNNSTSRKQMDVVADVKETPDLEPVTEQDLKPHRVKP